MAVLAFPVPVRHCSKPFCFNHYPANWLKSCIKSLGLGRFCRPSRRYCAQGGFSQRTLADGHQRLTAFLENTPTMRVARDMAAARAESSVPISASVRILLFHITTGNTASRHALTSIRGQNNAGLNSQEKRYKLAANSIAAITRPTASGK